MRNLFIAGAAGLFVAAAPAVAQEATSDTPFSGVYVGVAGGYDVQPNDVGSSILFDRGIDGRFGDAVTTATGANAFGTPVGGFCNGRATAGTSPTSPTAPARCTNDKNGYAYYARAGADVQRGSIVVGFVGEFGKSEINDSVSAFSTTPASYTMYREVQWEGSVRGRIGFAADTTLFYATGGPSYAKIDRAFFTTNTANAFAGRGDRMQLGITGGGGIEQKLNKNFSIGLEYMHHRYDDGDYRVRATQGTAAATNPFVLGAPAGTDFRRSDTKFVWSSVRATAAFRF